MRSTRNPQKAVRNVRRGVAVAAFVCLAGGSSGGAAVVADAAMASDAAATYTPLLSRSWTVAQGQFDAYACSSMIVPADIYVHTFHADRALGSHHVILSITDQTDIPTGDYDCTGGNYDPKVLYAAGLGSTDLELPDGVAMKIPAGSHLNLSLHLFNATDGPLQGTAGVSIEAVDAAEVVTEAEQIFSGTRTISIPADDMPHTAQGGCVATRDYNVFGIWPLMYADGTHQTFSVLRSGQTAPDILLDENYIFSEQTNDGLGIPAVIHAGDQLSTTCTYVNATSDVIVYGESDTTPGEVCYTGLYRYPADGTDPFLCAEN